eukprot:gene7110-14458_t
MKYLVCIFLFGTAAISNAWKSPFRQSTTLTLQLRKPIGILVGALLPFIDASDILKYDSSNTIVLADSTGKMSTKLTARRRYLPRITTGVAQFNNLDKDNSLVSIFVDEQFPPLKRAMNLYGASLRKGETPDEVSRQAEAFVVQVEGHVNKLKLFTGAKLGEELKTTRSAIDEFLAFAKLPLSTSSDYVLTSDTSSK